MMEAKRRQGPSSDVGGRHLIDEDPRDTLSRLLAVEEGRVEARKAELATARNALLRLHALGASPHLPTFAPLTVEAAPMLLRSLLDESAGLVRNAFISPTVGSGVSPEHLSHSQEAIRRGIEQRTLYDDSVLDSPAGIAWVSDWAAVGERQRILAGVPSEFAIYDETAVVAAALWGDVTADYVVIRDAMLVSAFVELFDRLWEAGSPMPSARANDEAEEAHLLELLSRGLKDEAIARYLGWSLRTVRRRVARLMNEMGARTRFQLGAAVVRAGRLDRGTGPAAGNGPPGPASEHERWTRLGVEPLSG